MKKPFFALAIGATLFSCDQADKAKVAGEAAINMDAAQTTIAATNEKFGKAMAAGDSATLVSFYHSQAQILPPNMPTFTDRSGIGSLAKHLPAMGIKNVTLKSTELLNGGDYVIERGAYEMAGDAKSIDKGKYIVIWKQEGGEWKLFRDIWNSDNPPPPPASN